MSPGEITLTQTKPKARNLKGEVREKDNTAEKKGLRGCEKKCACGQQQVAARDKGKQFIGCIWILSLDSTFEFFPILVLNIIATPSHSIDTKTMIYSMT